MGIVGEPRGRVADADLFQKLDDPRPRRRTREVLVQGEAFGELPLDRVERVERGHRLLEDEADVVAADGAQPRLGRADHLGALIADAARQLGRVAQKLDGAERGDGLARAGFANQRHRLAAADGEADAADGEAAAALGAEGHGEVADLEDRRGVPRVGPGRCPGPRDIWVQPEGGGGRWRGRDGRGGAGAGLHGRDGRRGGVQRIAHLKVLRGSKASRMPSKMNTRSDSMIAKVKKAVKPSHGACRFCLACSASSPSEGAEAGRP